MVALLLDMTFLSSVFLFLLYYYNIADVPPSLGRDVLEDLKHGLWTGIAS